MKVSINTTFSAERNEQQTHTTLKFDEVLDLARCDVDHHSIVYFDKGVGVSNGAAIAGHNEWDTLGSYFLVLHSAEFVLKNHQQSINNDFYFATDYKVKIKYFIQP